MNDREARIAARAKSLQDTFGMRPGEAREAALVGMGLHAEAALMRESIEMPPETVEALRRRAEAREARLAEDIDIES